MRSHTRNRVGRLLPLLVAAIVWAPEELRGGRHQVPREIPPSPSLATLLCQGRGGQGPEKPRGRAQAAAWARAADINEETV